MLQEILLIRHDIISGMKTDGFPLLHYLFLLNAQENNKLSTEQRRKREASIKGKEWQVAEAEC